MRTALSAVLSVAVVAAISGTARAQDRVTDLLGWVPPRTNLVLFVDADVIAKSPIAQKEKWGTAGDPVSGLDTLPPGISKLVVAAQFDPGPGLSGEVIVARLKKQAADADLLKKAGGTRDKIAGRDVILTPRNRFLVNLAPGLVGAYQPANRQDAGRWLREVNGKVSPNLSPLLAQAGAEVGLKYPAILVLDATDMFSPALVKAKLATTEAFKGKATRVAAVADLFGQLRSVTLLIGVDAGLTGEVRLDFSVAADPLAGFAQPLMLEVLKRSGLHAAEMDRWEATVKGKTVTFSGPLTKEAANDLLAPLLRPSLGTLDHSAEPEPSPEEAKAQASLKYYQAVYKKMSDVKKTNPPTFQKLTSIFNTAARYIEELPILNVDDELLDWGAATATTFRTMAIVAQKTGGAMTLAEANRAMSVVSTPNYYYGSGGGYGVGYGGGYGWGYNYAIPSGTASTAVVGNYGAIDNLQTITSQNEALYRRETWKNIDAATLALKRKMVKKYNIEF